jgi:dTDP-glucose 4,6-dehydratase
MRVLVTGGAGFIGSNLVRHALAADDTVHVTTLDALTYAGNRSSLRDLDDHPRHRFVRGDVCDAELVDRLVAEADAVVHLAAESHVDRSIDRPAAFLRTNVDGAGVVFEAARRHQVERVLFTSTDEVYGSIARPGRFHEHDALRPSSPYSASKAGADLLAHAYGVTYGFPITVTRTTNNLGPYHHPEKVVPRFVTSLLDGGRIPLYGDGSNVREWTYVLDNVAAQWLVLTRGDAGAVYNVGSGEERSNLELTHAIVERMGADPSVIDHVPDRPGHDHRYAVDSSKVRELGWSPSVTFDEALDATIAWYRANEWWWRPLVASGDAERRGLA